MIRLVSILAFFIISFEAHSCFISSFETIIKSSGSSLDERIIKESDCSKDIQDKFISFANENTGDISSRSVNLYLDQSITLNPEVVSVMDLNNFIKDRFHKRDYKVEDAKIIGNNKVLLIDNNKKIAFECKNCSQLGNVNYKISQGGSVTWGSAVVKEATTGLVARNNLSYSNKTLFPAHFERKKIYTSNPEQVFKNFKQISFYKLNKNIRSGHIIQNNDVTSALLVRIGHPVNVTYKSEGIVLSYPAKALRSGRMGDVIQLEGRNRKKIFAKITGYNKAIIEL